MVLAAALVVAAAILWAAWLVTGELRADRVEMRRARTLAIVTAFAPGIVAARSDPRALLTWEPLARTARGLCPEEMAAIDRAAGATFPFPNDVLQAAHAQWTADWLAWEGTHDAEYKRRAAEAAHEAAAAEPALVRARLDAIEREKLDLYQRRYGEYVRVAKALQGLINAKP
jgi:hypothetical protein